MNECQMHLNVWNKSGGIDMKTKNKKSLNWEIRKYSRWMRHRLKRVRMVEQEIGYKIQPC